MVGFQWVLSKRGKFRTLGRVKEKPQLARGNWEPFTWTYLMVAFSLASTHTRGSLMHTSECVQPFFLLVIHDGQLLHHSHLWHSITKACVCTWQCSLLGFSLIDLELGELKRKYVQQRCFIIAHTGSSHKLLYWALCLALHWRKLDTAVNNESQNGLTHLCLYTCRDG